MELQKRINIGTNYYFYIFYDCEFCLHGLYYSIVNRNQTEFKSIDIKFLFSYTKFSIKFHEFLTPNPFLAKKKKKKTPNPLT